MKQSHFFAHLSRLKLINRWPLMRNVRTENVSEHSLQVAMVAHALAAIKNRKFGGNVNAERIALLAMYHDASEVLTGNLPTPVKYFNSQIAQEYKAIEKIAQQKLVDMVPEELQDIFAPLIDEHAYSDEEKSLVKQADALCAYLNVWKNSRPEIMNSCWQKRDWKRRLKRVAARRWTTSWKYLFPASIFRSMRLARIHRCKQPESASHQAISAGCDIRLLSKRKQHRDHHHTNRHHDNGERYPQLHKVTEAVISRT